MASLPERKPVSRAAALGRSQLLRFAVVGGIGFVVDAGVLHLLLALETGPYRGRVLSFLAAATATWLLNRRFTFRAVRRAGLHREWAQYLALMVAGGVVNYGVYALCLENSALVRALPALGVAAGSVAGMAVNFVTAKYLVFRRPTPR